MRRKQQGRLTATERVEQHIRQAIYRGALKPRERVIEEDLAAELKCSRGPVREALLRLERDGLIVTLPRRGTFIQDVSIDSIEVIFAMRGKLEGLCVRYLREHLTVPTEKAVRDALKRMKSAASQGDDEAFLEADMHLHQTIWSLANREILDRHLGTIMNPFIFILARTYSTRTPLALRYEEHAQYVETILTAPLARVERLVEQYFEGLATAILSVSPYPLLSMEKGQRSASARR